MKINTNYCFPQLVGSQFLIKPMPCKFLCYFFRGVGASLKSLLKDPDATVRHKATEVLSIIAGTV